METWAQFRDMFNEKLQMLMFSDIVYNFRNEFISM